MSLSELKKLINPPAIVSNIWTAASWKVVEEELGTELPEDYKGFIEMFGLGKVNEFLTILVPHVSSKYVKGGERGKS